MHSARQIRGLGPARARFAALLERAREAAKPDPALAEALQEVANGLEELRAQHQRYRDLFDLAPDAYLVTDGNGIIIEANRAAARLFNITQDYLIGKALAVYIESESKREFFARLADMPRLEEQTNWELTLRPRQGPAVPVSISSSVSFIEMKTLPARKLEIFWLLRDLREKVRAERILRESEERYRSAFERLEERLRQRESLAAVGSTVAVLAHEISNPLTGMYTIIQMMERQLAGKEAELPGLASHLRDLNLETHRLGDLLNDFRLLAQTQYSFEPVCLKELIAEVLNLQSVSYADSGIRVELDLDAGLPSITGDKSKLKQALLNLCKNSVEAMAGGGLLTIRANKADGKVIVEISDTGPGIPKEIDVFEPFVTTKEYGTGLGLPIVRQIVVAHGGNVIHSGEPGQGATFQLILPIQTEKKI